MAQTVYLPDGDMIPLLRDDLEYKKQTLGRIIRERLGADTYDLYQEILDEIKELTEYEGGNHV